MRQEIVLRPNGSKRVLMYNEDPSLTRQEFKDDCDLEKIIKRFSKTPGGMEALENAQGYLNGQFQDVSGVLDYQAAWAAVKRAGEVFEALPSMLRKRFDHDPAKFLQFCEDPGNLEEMRSLGLAKPLETKAAPTT